MDHEPGDEYDCDACGETHVVRRGKGLRVTGSSGGLDPAVYVRCPVAGFVPLSAPDATAGDASADDVADDEWP